MNAEQDRPVREQAIAADSSCIVQAPAGSGKTELLVQRYLNLLAHVREPEEIVAITFTLKAAGEMRDRIVAALRTAAAGRPDGSGSDSGEPSIESRRLALARRAVDNDRRRGWEITNHPSRLQIQTIDALCLALTRQLPLLSGFAAPSGILEDANAAYRRAAVDTLRLLGSSNESWRDALAKFLIHVDNDLWRAVALIATMLASRDQWLRHVGDERLTPGKLELVWREVIEANLRRTLSGFPEPVKMPLVECADAAASRLVEVVPTAAAWRAGKGFPGPEADDLPRWQFLVHLLLTQQSTLRRQVRKQEGFPPKSHEKETMQSVLAMLADCESMPGLLSNVKSLPYPTYAAGQTGILNAMVTILKLAVAQLELIFEETAQVDFIEVTQRAVAALGALEDPSDLALKLDYQIQHLLVDEFQDTSLSQYRLLQLLTQGWAPEDGKTLFLVGDPMQSIYRFREAEVGVYLKVWEEGLSGVPVQPLTLCSNFRSSPAVVDWVNHAFSLSFPQVSDPLTGAVGYSQSSPRIQGSEQDGVYVHPFVDCPEIVQGRRLAELIAGALDRSNQVAVLVRARSHLTALLPALRERDIPYTGLEVTALMEQPGVRDLYSLTRVGLHPGDRIAWFAVLRAPWCGLVLKDLIAVAGTRGTSIWTGLHDPEVRANLSGEGLARVDRLIAALTDPMDQRGRLSLHQWVRRAWVNLDGPALVDGMGLKHVHGFFELLRQHQSGAHLSDDLAFKDALDRQWAHAEPHGPAVQLMTIHKAKGLEFDEVFLPALERQTPIDEERLLLWEEPPDGRGLLLAALSARGGPDDKHYEFVRQLQSEKARNETDRLLYVACTRARHRLHLLANLQARDGVPVPPKKGSLLHRIWPSLEARFADIDPGSIPAAQHEIPGLDTRQVLKRVPADWRSPGFPESLRTTPALPMDERTLEFSWVGETARQVGVLVHDLIQRIAEQGIGQWDKEKVELMLPVWRDRLAHIGVPSHELDEAVRRTADSIRNLLEDERAAWLLGAEHAQTENEYEIDFLDGQRLRRMRVDRTFVDEQGVRWVVDYKTSAHEGGAREAFLDEEARRYRMQMETYARAFRRMGDNEIRLALYFPLLKGWREWRYTE